MERGIVRVLTNCDGNENPYVFTWSDEMPNTTWALGSGCSTFYNTAEEADSNTHMERDFVNNTFVIKATKVRRGRESKKSERARERESERARRGGGFSTDVSTPTKPTYFTVKDIKAQEELIHRYKSKSWRKCFVADKALNDDSATAAAEATEAAAGTEAKEAKADGEAVEKAE